jgi:hypothetical protein
MKILIVADEHDEVVVARPEDLRDPNFLYTIRDTGLRHIAIKKYSKVCSFLSPEKEEELLGFRLSSECSSCRTSWKKDGWVDG